MSFTGIRRQDKTLDIQFDIVNTTASKSADEKMKTAAQATVAKRLAEDSAFRDSVIKALENAIDNVGSRTGEIEGAKILLEILQNMK